MTVAATATDATARAAIIRPDTLKFDIATNNAIAMANKTAAMPANA